MTHVHPCCLIKCALDMHVCLCDVHKGEQRDTTTVGCYLCAQVTNKSISTTIKLGKTETGAQQFTKHRSARERERSENKKRDIFVCLLEKAGSRHYVAL